jgi:hypothetical protein
MIEVSDTPFLRRTYFRAFFAFTEGLLFFIREKTTQWLVDRSLQNARIEIAKLMLLTDLTYSPDASGVLKSQPSRIPFRNYCAFIMRTAFECCLLDTSNLFSDSGWQKMQESLNVRHRITHPKQPDHLEIADKELVSLRAARDWLFKCLAAIQNSPEMVQGNSEQLG